jgi:hypothetical protein
VHLFCRKRPSFGISPFQSLTNATKRTLTMSKVQLHDIEYEWESEKKHRSPLVIVGAALTVGVLGAGLFAFKHGNQRVSQQLMRLRVLTQGATVAVMAATSGVIAFGSKDDGKNKKHTIDLDQSRSSS